MAEKAQITLTAKDDTGSAFASAKRNLAFLQAAVAGVTGGAAFAAIQEIGHKLAEVFEKIDPREVIELGDQLFKLGQKTGIGVETLQAYQFAAKLANVTNEDLAIGLKKLSLNIAAATRGEAEQVAAFNAIGISSKSLQENVGKTDKVFEAIAERISGYADGARKNALSNAFFGKSFETLIPLLDDGKEGLEKAREELNKYGVAIDAAFGEKSQVFNDNLTRLSVAGQKLKVVLAEGLIDYLVEYSEQAVQAAQNGGLLKFSLEKLGEFLSGRLTRSFAFGKSLDPERISEAQQEVERLSNIIVGLQNNLARDPGNAGLAKYLDLLTDKLKAAQEQVRGDKIGGGRGVVNPELVTPGPEAVKPDAPAIPDASKVEALLKKQLDGRLKALEAGLERERDLFQFADQRLAEEFQHGDLSIDEFYDRKAKAQLEFLATQQEGFTAEIAALRAHEAKTKDPASKEDDRNKIKEVIDRQAKAFREAGQSAEAAGVQQSRAAEAFAKSLRDVDAQLADLGGDKFGADLLRNAQRLDDARKLLSQKPGPENDARLTALQNGLELQAQATKAQDESQRSAESAANAEELFNIRAARAGLDRNEAERGLLALHEKQLTALDGEIERYGKLIERSAELNKGVADPALISFYENLKLARERAFDAKDPGLIRFNELATQAGDDIAEAFENAQLEGGKLRDVLAALGKDLFKLVYHDLVTKPLAGQITNAIKGLGESGTGGGGEKLLSGIGNSIAKMFGFGSDAKMPPAPAGTAPGVAANTGDFTRTDHDTTPLALALPGTSSSSAAQLAATERATTALQALADAANAASGALGKPPGTVAPAPSNPAVQGASTAAPEASAEQAAAIGESADSSDAAAQSLDQLGASAQSSAATFDSAIATMAEGALRGSTALGGLPGALSIFTNYLSQLLSSSSSGGGGGLGSLFAMFSGGGSGASLDAAEAAAIVEFAHKGGIIGTTNDPRPVSAKVFATARRMHDGGAVGGGDAGAEAAPAPVAGLAPNEVPAILMGGPKGTREEVLHADDPRHQDNLHGVAFQRFLSQLVRASPVAARAFHTGGLVSPGGGAALALPASLWQGAERYHGGGIVGMLEPGQMSMVGASDGDWTRHEPSAEGAGSTQALHVYVTPPPGASRDSATQSGVQIGQGIQRALRRRGG